MTNELQHAKLSASGAHRWMNCHAAPRLEEGIEETTSAFAQEGDNAHTDAELILLGKMALEESQYNVGAYVEYVEEHASTGTLLVEQRLPFTDWVKDGFGTCDAVVITDDDIHIIDLKYGQGIKVNADNNSQLRLYALGALQAYMFEHEPSTVTMSIVQPRLDHVSRETIDIDTLLAWGEVVRGHAIATEQPHVKPTPGVSQCQWCKAKAVCRERAIHALAIPDTDKLTPAEIAMILPFADEVKAWANSFSGDVLEMALSGTSIPGYKLVAGRSTRKWLDNAADVLKDHVKDSDQLYDKKLLGITAMTKLLKNKKVVDSCCYKPEGKPTLVNSNDKRPEIMPVIVEFPTEEKE